MYMILINAHNFIYATLQIDDFYKGIMHPILSDYGKNMTQPIGSYIVSFDEFMLDNLEKLFIISIIMGFVGFLAAVYASYIVVPLYRKRLME